MIYKALDVIEIFGAGRKDGRTDGRTYGNSPLCSTGHRPFGAAAQKTKKTCRNKSAELCLVDRTFRSGLLSPVVLSRAFVMNVGLGGGVSFEKGLCVDSGKKSNRL